jgi:hypothetical protein
MGIDIRLPDGGYRYLVNSSNLNHESKRLYPATGA